MDEVKVQIWYDSESIFKRMEGISVGIGPFNLDRSFSTKKEYFDEWIKFLLKQTASQVFNVLGQKIFGSS
jgi:hypothetical protein